MATQPSNQNKSSSSSSSSSSKPASTAKPPLVLNPKKRAPLLKTQSYIINPEPRLPAHNTKTHPNAPPSDSQSSLQTGNIFFIGTATTLIQYHGVRILTDPNFLHAGDHVHLGPGVTAQRLTEPAIPALSALPPIDCVLLSHYHEDHFDKEVEAQLGRQVPIITTIHARSCLVEGKPEGVRFERVWGMDVWDEIVMPIVVEEEDESEKRQPAIKVTAMPGKHVPSGLLGMMNELLGAVPPTNGWMVDLGRQGGSGEQEFKTGLRIYISGDTLFVDELKDIPKWLKGEKIDIMLVHLGGTTILGPKLPLIMVTMDAEQGVKLIRLVNPDVTIPIHFDDYDTFLSPLENFKREVVAAGLVDKVVYLERGEEYQFTVRNTA